MQTHSIWAVLISCAIVTACGGQQPEPTENLEPDAASAAAETAGVAEIGPAVDPARSAPAPSPRGDSLPAPAQPLTARTEPPQPSAPQWHEVTIPADTALPLELMTAISSETAQVETPVRARVRQALVVDGYTALPAGTVLHGSVTAVERAGRVQGRARLAFRFTEADFDGGREDLRTNAVAFEGEATRGEDATKIGAGAVGGAIIGGILGGGSGATQGAAIGGAAGTGVVLATRGREVSLAAGTSLAATLASPFTIRVAAR
jgi:hypothetical protein